MSSPDCSNLDAYSDDFSDNTEGSSDEKQSLHSTESSITNEYVNKKKKSIDCSCQTDITQIKTCSSIGETSTVYKHRSLQQKQAKLQESSDTDVDDSILYDKDVNTFSTTVTSQRNRMRKLSEPTRKCRFDASHQRAKTQAPNKKIGRQKAQSKNIASNNATQTGSVATQKLLSARKLKIDGLRNQIIDLERQLLAEQKENKILRNLYNRQQKELNKVEVSRVEIPELEKAHDEEIRVLKTLMRKVQDKNKELESKLKAKDEELQRRFSMIQSLKLSLQEKKKAEGENEKLVSALKMRIQKRDENIMVLKENLNASEKKQSEDRKNHDSIKTELKNLKKRYDELRKTSGELKVLKQSAIKACEATNDAGEKSPNSPARNDGRKLSKSQEITLSQEKGDESSVPILKGNGSNLEDPTCADNEQNVNIVKKDLSRPATSTKQSLLKSSNSSALKQQQYDVKTIMKLSPSSSSSVRVNTRKKAAHSQDMHVPLIIPTSAPRKSATESDSSYTDSYNKESNCDNYTHYYNAHDGFMIQNKIKHDVAKQR